MPIHLKKQNKIFKPTPDIKTDPLSLAIKRAIAGSTSGVLTALLMANTAVAQNISQQDELIEEVVVTGTRIRRDGYEAPTPTTVATSQDLLLSDPGTLSDGLNQLPQFQGSSQPQDGGVSANGAAGSNLLSLRNLGSQRNLVLLNGRRFVAATDAGSTDINLLPQNLVQRVEFVTGGASAAYGSDAVAGVVNFILDTNFEGWKGSAQAGTSTYGDSDRQKADLAFGTSFADGRGHMIFSAEYFDNEDIGTYDSNRDWNERGSGRINNTTGNGTRTLLLKDNGTVSAATFGGLITSGPLSGTKFNSRGQPVPFATGDFRSSTFMVGGDGIRNDRNLSGGLERWSVFGRADYDLTSDVNVFAELTYSEADTQWEQYYNYCYTSCSATIFSDNAFLPDATRQAMADAGVDSFRLGRIHSENYILADNQKDVWRLALGLDGQLDNGWTYDASFTQGESDTYIANEQTMHYRRYYAAVDAVVDPVTGQTVCRSTLSGYDPGCVPFNPFGQGAPSAAAMEYVTPDEWRNLVLEQTVIAASLQGTLADFSGRDIGFAAGLEWREESSDQKASLLSQEIVDFTGIRGANPSIEGQQGPFIVGNPQPLSGSYDVTEVFAEVAIPLIYDKPLISALELDLAARYTDYSLSGGVNTWKASMNYAPIDDVRIRATRSKDIRAANVAELFTGSRQGIGTARDPNTGNTVDVVTKTRGNPTLDPEEADTLTFGVVVQPAALEGFSFSIDYYDIEIDGAVSTLGRQETFDECYEGNQTACNNIELVGTTYRLDLPYLNLDLLEISGYDIEMSYQTDLGAGDLNLRFLANYQDEFARTTPGGVRDDQAGEVGRSDNPRWKGIFSANYSIGNLSIFGQQRYVDSGIYDNSLVEGVTINDNSVDHVWYTDLTTTYRFGDDDRSEVYLSINNLFNEEPPFSPQVSGTHLSWSNYSLYDSIGRYYNLGYRYNF